MNYTGWVSSMLESTSKLDSEQLIKDFQFDNSIENELLFFFKPECFLAGHEESTKAIFKLAMTKFQEFNVSVSGILLLRGNRLGDLEIMDKHYGYINLLSRKASMNVSKEDMNSIWQNLGIDKSEDIKILGGHEFLKEYPQFDEQSLDELWASKKSLKLKSGFYYQQYIVNGKELVLINGFHPSQLRHFTNPDHLIIVCLLHSNTGWKELKNNLIGNTFPEKADENSIRGILYKESKKFGISDVSIANNYVHLSAGPFEAFFEINNFLSRLDIIDFHLNEANLYRIMLSHGLNKHQIEHSLSNPKILSKDNEVDLFSLTEEYNSTEAIDLYSKIILSGESINR